MHHNTKPSPKNFIFMVIGQIVSVLGSAMLRFALSLYILDITGRPDIFAALQAISGIPFLLSPLGGAIADRFNRRNLMVIFDFASSAIVFFFFISFSNGHHSLIPIGSVMFILAAISSMYTTTVTACIPQLVDERMLESANGIVQAVQAVSGVAAPVLGGILYSIFDVRPLVIISCVSFFLSAIMEIFINIPFIKREQNEHIIPTIIKDMRDGLVYAVREPFILKAMILGALVNLLLTPLLIVGTPIILRVTMQSSDVMYGVGMGLVESAVIFGSLGVGLFTKKLRINTLFRWLLAVSFLLWPAAVSVTPYVLGLGYYPSFLLFMSGAVPIMMLVIIITIFVVSKIQKKTPNENLGKVMSIIIAVSGCATPIGQIIYGVIFEKLDTVLYLPLFVVSLLMFVMTAFTRRIFKNES